MIGTTTFLMTKILFVVSEDWYFLSHRFSLAKTLLNEGNDIYLLCSKSLDSNKIESAGINVIPWNFRRDSRNPFQEILSILDLYNVIRKIQPSIVYSVALKPNLYSGIVSYFLSARKQIFAVGGLGYLFQEKNKSLIKNIFKYILKYSFSKQNSNLIVQNSYDRDFFYNLKIPKENIHLIEGSGVDINQFQYSPLKKFPCRVIFIGRLLYDKGINDFINLSKRFEQNNNIEFIVAGDRDPQNPECVEEKTLDEWKITTKIKFLGRISNMNEAIANAHIVCFPSYHEGLPKALLEASSVGRPIVAYDIPGCRAIVQNDNNGYLVPLHNEEELFNKVNYLFKNPEVLSSMGRNGRSLVLEKFSDTKIYSKIKLIIDN